MRRGVDWSKAALKGEHPAALEGGLPTPFAGLAERGRTPATSEREPQLSGPRVSTCGSKGSWSWSECTAREQRSRNGGDLPGVFASLGKARAGVQEHSVWTGLHDRKVRPADWAKAPTRTDANGGCGCRGCVDAVKALRKSAPKGTSLFLGRTWDMQAGIAPGRRSATWLRDSSKPSTGRIATNPESHTSQSREDELKATIINEAMATGNLKLLSQLEELFAELFPEFGRPAILEVPKDWEAGATCELKGDSSFCQVYLDSKTFDEFLSLDLNAVYDNEDLDGSMIELDTSSLEHDELGVPLVDDEEIGLLRHAWALLAENTDLIMWTLCWVTGNERKGVCMVKKVLGEGGRVTIKITNDEDNISAHTARSRIRLNRRTLAWTKIYGGYWSGLSENDPKRICGAILFASILLHEIAHLCNRSHFDKYIKEDECNAAYTIEATIQYALAQRYADAQMDPCCGDITTVAFGDGTPASVPASTCA